MTETATTNGLSRVEFTTTTAAHRLGVSEAEFRILAKRAGKTAPFTESDLHQIKAVTTPEPVGIVAAGERFEDAIAPLEPSPAPGDADLYATARAALKAQLVARLKADFTTIETEALKEILG